MIKPPSAAFIAAWQRLVNYWLARSDAAWDELAATPHAVWSHPLHRRIKRARVALRALLDLRDAVTDGRVTVPPSARR